MLSPHMVNMIILRLHLLSEKVTLVFIQLKIVTFKIIFNYFSVSERTELIFTIVKPTFIRLKMEELAANFLIRTDFLVIKIMTIIQSLLYFMDLLMLS